MSLYPSLEDMEADKMIKVISFCFVSSSNLTVKLFYVTVLVGKKNVKQPTFY